MAASVSIDIYARDRGATNNLNRFGSAADRAGNQFSKLGGIAKAGGLAIAAGAAAAVAGIMRASDVEQEFSRTMRLVEANTGATADQLKSLEQAATTMGPKLGFGARQSAGAVLELAKAGLDANQIIRGGLRGTLTLAAAGAVDLGAATTIASNAMNSFGLKSSEMTRIAGILAGGANSSTASVESLGIALSQVGPGARTAGLSLNETVAALSAFDNAGIKGSDSGTSLKTMLARLVPQTDKARGAMKNLGLDFTKADGSFLSLEQIAQQLQDRLGDLSAEQRTTALATVFGSDATRAATVLSREGADGIRKYIKATQDQKAAQKAVTAQTSGTSGAMKRLEAATEVAQLKIGQAFAPDIIKAADALSSRLVPATETAIKFTKEWRRTFEENGIDGVVSKIEELTDTQGKLSPILDEVTLAGESFLRIVQELAPAIADAASQWPPFLSPLKLTGDALRVVADVLEAIPDPLKSLGVQAGIAALILPRLTAGVASASSAFMVGTTRAIGFAQALRSTGTAAQAQAFSQLGSAARSAAGIGGILALTQGVQQADQATSVLMSTVGGAALGFSVGGPLGAGIGAAAGAMIGFATGTDQATKASEKAKAPVVDLTNTYKGLSAAVTQSTRDQVAKQLFDDEQLGYANDLGLTKRTLIDAILGEGDAYKQVKAAIKQYQDATLLLGNNAPDSLADAEVAALSLRRYLRETIPQWEANRRGAASLAQASSTWRAALKGIPRKWDTRIRALVGAEPEKIERFARKAKLTPKQVNILFRALEVNRVSRDIDNVTAKTKRAGRDAKFDGRPFTASVGKAMTEGENIATRGGRAIAKQGTRSASKVEFDGSQLRSTLSRAMENSRGSASSGGLAIGASLGSGLISGIALRSGAVQAAAAGVIRSAIAAARREAQTRSPSRKTWVLGQQMGDGAVFGLRSRNKNLSDAGVDLVRSLVKGITKEKVKADRVVAAIAKQVEKTRDRLQNLKSARASVLSDFAGFQSTVFGASAPTDAEGNAGPMTVDSLLQFQADQRDQAVQVRGAVARLTRMGLSGDLIKQLQSQGAGGIEQILTLANANQAQIRLLNSLNAQTAGAYRDTGSGVFAATGGAAQLAAAQRDANLASAVARAVDAAMTKREAEYQFIIKGDTLVAVLKKNDRNKGK